MKALMHFHWTLFVLRLINAHLFDQNSTYMFALLLLLFCSFQLVKTSKIWSFLLNLLLQFKLQTRFLERKLQFWVIITSWKRRFGSENEVSNLNWYNNLEMRLLFQNISFDSTTEASILETKHLLKQETNSSNELSQIWHLLVSSSFIYWTGVWKWTFWSWKISAVTEGGFNRKGKVGTFQLQS